MLYPHEIFLVMNLFEFNSPNIYTPEIHISFNHVFLPCTVVGDSLGFDHNGHAFSTADHDVDGADKVNCAQKHHGGYWYSSCFKSNINGQWGKAGEQGIVWGSFKNWEMYVLKETTMMIRPVLH